MAEVRTLTKSEQPPFEMAALRLECVGNLYEEIATSINETRDLLQRVGETSLEGVVAAALDRLGWIAERATAIARDRRLGDLVGDADEWLLHGYVKEQIAKIELEDGHGSE